MLNAVCASESGAISPSSNSGNIEFPQTIAVFLKPIKNATKSKKDFKIDAFVIAKNANQSEPRT